MADLLHREEFDGRAERISDGAAEEAPRKESGVRRRVVVPLLSRLLTQPPA